MKLRSFSFFALIAIGAAGALSYKKVKNHFRKKLHREVKEIVQEEAARIEKDMVEKYDMAVWDQEYVDEFDKEHDQKIGWDQVEERKEEKDKINEKSLAIQKAIEKEHPRCCFDLTSTKQIALSNKEKYPTKFTI